MMNYKSILDHLSVAKLGAIGRHDQLLAHLIAMAEQHCREQARKKDEETYLRDAV